MKVNVCKHASHEWRNGELFVIPEKMGAETAWLTREQAENIRESCPEDVEAKEDELIPIFLIDRTPEGDKIHELVGAIVFAGGAVLCIFK